VRRPGVSPSLPSVAGVARPELASSAAEASSVVDVAGAGDESGFANGLGVEEVELPNPN